jgi:hypothetical protein
MHPNSPHVIPMDGAVRGTLYWSTGWQDSREASQEGWFQLNERGNGLVKCRKVGGRRWFALTDIERCTLFIPYVKAVKA